MKAQDFNLQSTFTKILNQDEIQFLSIPRYQRNYSWGKEQLEDFWKTLELLLADYPEDLKEQGLYLKQYYFFGSLLLQKTSEQSTHLEIVDGQQRTITFFLLIIGILVLGQSHVASFSEELQTLAEIFFDTDGNSKLSVKNKDKQHFEELLAHYNIYTHQGRQDIQTILETWLKIQEEPKKKSPKLTGKIQENAVFLYGRLKNLTQDQIQLLARIITSKIRYIQIVLESHEDAYTIFDTMNSTGLGLTFADIVKNLLGRWDSTIFDIWETYFELPTEPEQKIFWENHMVRLFQQYTKTVMNDPTEKLTARERERQYRDQIRFYDAPQAHKELRTIITFANQYATIRANYTKQMRTNTELKTEYN